MPTQKRIIALRSNEIKKRPLNVHCCYFDEENSILSHMKTLFRETVPTFIVQYLGDDQRRKTIYSGLNIDLQAATEEQGCLQTVQGKAYFIGLHLADQETETTPTNSGNYTVL
jgi:hypothetical protein